MCMYIIMQLSVDDGQKTKENYRLTIKKLREENTALKTKGTDPGKEKASMVVVKPEKPVSKEQQDVDEMIVVRVERTQLKKQLQSAQRDIDSLRAQIKGHSLEQQATDAIKRKVHVLLCMYCMRVYPVSFSCMCLFHGMGVSSVSFSFFLFLC